MRIDSGVAVAERFPSADVRRKVSERLEETGRPLAVSADFSELTDDEVRFSLRGLQDDIVGCRVADGAIADIQDILGVAREWAVRAANDAPGLDGARAAYELADCADRIDDIVRNARKDGAGRYFDTGAANAFGVRSFSLATTERAAEGLAHIDAAVGDLAARRAVLAVHEDGLSRVASGFVARISNTVPSLSRLQDAPSALAALEAAKSGILQRADEALSAQANLSAAEVRRIEG